MGIPEHVTVFAGLPVVQVNPGHPPEPARDFGQAAYHLGMSWGGENRRYLVAAE